MMSATATQPQMTGQEAHTVLMREVFAPMFLDKLAAAGVTWNSEAEAQSLVNIGVKLLAADNTERVKQAGHQANFLKQAEADLDAEFQRRYGTAPPAPTAETDYLQKAAEVLGGHEMIQNAVEAYNWAVLNNQPAA